MPGFASISPHDEAKYIDSGRSLTMLQVRDLAWGPLVGAFYAPLHYLFKDSLDWFMLQAWAGRMLLWILLWISVFYLSTKFAGHAHPYIAAGVLFVSPAFFPILENQSDALFLGLTVIALGLVLDFHRSMGLVKLAAASVLVGLAALTRAEGVLLLAILPAVAVVLGRGRGRVVRTLIASTIPAISVVLMYLAVQYALEGQLDLGFGNKSWDSFAMNQPASGDRNPYEETARLYGTAEENDFSVVRAVSRNPAAFAARLLVRASALPDLYLSFFTKRLGVTILFFAAWGAYALIRRRDWTFLWVAALWSIPAAVSLGFLVRHFLPQTSYIPLILTPIGLAFSLSPDFTRRHRVTFILSALLLAVYSVVDSKPAFVVGALAILAVVLLVWLLRKSLRGAREAPEIPLLLALAAGLILRAPFSFPDFPPLGASPSEKAIHYLQQTLPPGSSVISALPAAPIAARMEQVSPTDWTGSVATPDLTCQWVADKGALAIFVDGALRANWPELTDILGELIGRGIEVGLTEDPGPIQVLLVTPPCRGE